MNQIKITETVTNNDARAGLLAGVVSLADAVGSTLGPSGRTVIIENQYFRPKPTKDGVTVAKSIQPLDSVERMGADIIRQASLKTAEEAGDGTTSSTVVARAMIERGFEVMKDQSINFIEFKSGMDMALEDICAFVDKLSIPLHKDNLLRVASISANNDEFIGGLIRDAFDGVGKDGVVFMQPSLTSESYVSIVKGYELANGFADETFAKGQHKLIFKDPLVFISTIKLERIEQIEPQLKFAIANRRPIIIVAEVDPDLMRYLALNIVTKRVLDGVIINPTHFGVRQRDLLSDLAAYTGAELIDFMTGDNLLMFDENCLGTCEKVTVGRKNTVFFGGQDVSDRVEALKALLTTVEDKHEIPYIQERLAKISSAVAWVYVGAPSEAEQSEIADRVEDAIYATRAALESGIVPGGGMALVHASENVGRVGLSKSQTLGYNLVKWSAMAPAITILSNAGQISVKEVLTGARGPWDGMDVRTGEFGDMNNLGVIDPAKVVKSVMKNAVSAAITLLSTSSVIVNLRQI